MGDDVTKELHDFVSLQEVRDKDLGRLEELVRALEVRAWPWRAGGQDKDKREMRIRSIEPLGNGEIVEKPVLRTGGGYKKGGLDEEFNLIDQNKDGVITRSEFANSA